MKIMNTELAQKINKIKGIVPKSTPMAVLQSVLVKDGYLIANNMAMSIKAKIEGTEGETFLIPQKAFDIINNLPPGEVEIAQTGKETITIQTGSIRNTYKTFPPEQFPENKPIERNNEFTIDSSILLNAMRHVAWASKNEKQVSTMSSVSLRAQDGKLNFAALDGHVVAWDKIDYQGEFELLIPKSTIDKILSVGFEGKVSIRNNENEAVFESELYEVRTRLVNGDFYKYQKIFEDTPVSIKLNRLNFLEAMTRAKLCAAEQTPSRIEFSETELNISIVDSTTNYSETLPINEGPGEKILIGFDAKLVIEALQAFDSDMVYLGITSKKNPMIIKSDENDLKVLVLPVAIKG